MKIVITGASGQLGSELKDLLLGDSSVECFFLDRKQLPLDQTMIIQDILGMYEPDLIIHAAAYTAVDKAETEQDLAYRINHLATEEIAIYCRTHDVRLISISTDYVFDGRSAIPLKEDAPVNPLNAYGASKLAGEEAILKWCPEAIIIRTSWVYSAYGANFVKTMIRLMGEREEISVIADQIGSPTYAKDLAEAIVKISKSENWVPGIFHYSNEGEVSWYDFACAIRDIKGLECEVKAIETKDYPTAAKRPHYSLLDKTRIKEIYAVDVPQWRESLEEMLSEGVKR